MLELAKTVEQGVLPVYEMTELGELPEDWQVTALGDVTIRAVGGGTPSTKVHEYWDGDIPWTTSAYLNRIFLSDSPRYITKHGLANSSSHVVLKDNILVGTRVGVGKVAINLMDVAISQDLTGIIVNKQKATVEFLAYALLSDPIQRLFRKATRGTTIKGIPREDLLTFRIPLPPIPEQCAIAHALRTVQRAKETTEAVIAVTRELKKSLLGHLLTYGPVRVDEVDRVAVKETAIGSLPEHWNVVSLGEIIDSPLRNGVFVKRPEWGIGTPYLNVADVYPRTVVEGRVLKRMNLSDKDKASFAIEGGDLAFVRSSLKREGVAMACLVSSDGEPVVFDCHLIKISPDEGVVAPRYLVEYCRSARGHDRLISASKTTTMTTLPQSNLAGFTVALPPLSEQHVMAQMFEVIDRKSEMMEHRRLALDALFKTLLRDLMTGRQRLAVL